MSGLDGEVLASTAYGGDVILGGHFKWHSATQQMNYIARWDGENWQPFGDGISGTIYSFSEYECDLIAGGSFSFSEPRVNSIARWDWENWHPKGSGLDGVVEDLIADGDKLYIVGSFQ